MTNILVGLLLILGGVMQFAAARDPRLHISIAVDSFRWCIGWGVFGLGARLIWIERFGDEPGVSLWAHMCLVVLGLGIIGLQLNNFHRNSVHVPKFLRKALD